MTTAPPAGHWARLFGLNADLLLNALEGLTPAQASTAVVPGGNTIAFLIAHLVDTRHFLAGLLGAPIPNPVEQALAGVQSLADVRELPDLPALRAAWVEISRHVERSLAACDQAQLDAPCSSRLPGSDGTLKGVVGFLLQHDSYHLGQIAMLGRQHGLPGMSYRRGAMESEERVETRTAESTGQASRSGDVKTISG